MKLRYIVLIAIFMILSFTGLYLNGSDEEEPQGQTEFHSDINMIGGKNIVGKNVFLHLFLCSPDTAQTFLDVAGTYYDIANLVEIVEGSPQFVLTDSSFKYVGEDSIMFSGQFSVSCLMNNANSTIRWQLFRNNINLGGCAAGEHGFGTGVGNTINNVSFPTSVRLGPGDDLVMRMCGDQSNLIATQHLLKVLIDVTEIYN